MKNEIILATSPTNLTGVNQEMSSPIYCYHCGTHHPEEEMRQILTKDGKRWRCIKSIEAAKRGLGEREAYGRQTTAINKADAQTVKSRMANPEWKAGA